MIFVASWKIIHLNKSMKLQSAIEKKCIRKNDWQHLLNFNGEKKKNYWCSFKLYARRDSANVWRGNSATKWELWPSRFYWDFSWVLKFSSPALPLNTNLHCFRESSATSKVSKCFTATSCHEFESFQGDTIKTIPNRHDKNSQVFCSRQSEYVFKKIVNPFTDKMVCVMMSSLNKTLHYRICFVVSLQKICPWIVSIHNFADITNYIVFFISQIIVKCKE